MFAVPIHTGTVRGKPVRFFKSPVADPDMPWHASYDLFKALDLPRDVRRKMAHGLADKFSADTRTVDTGAGVTILAQHYAAQAMISGLISIGFATEALDIEYAKAVGGALDALSAHISDLEGRLNFKMAAASRHIHGPGEAPPKIKLQMITPPQGGQH